MLVPWQDLLPLLRLRSSKVLSPRTTMISSAVGAELVPSDPSSSSYPDWAETPAEGWKEDGPSTFERG